MPSRSERDAQNPSWVATIEVAHLVRGQMYNLGRGKLKKPVTFRGARQIPKTHKSPERVVLAFDEHLLGTAFTRTLLASEVDRWVALEVSPLTKEQLARLALATLKRS